MTNVFLTGGQAAIDQPNAPIFPAIPSLDGTQQGMENTINALATAVKTLTGQNPSKSSPPQNQNQNQNRNPNRNQNPNRNNKQPNNIFTEVTRLTSDVKITNPDDNTQFVMVKQITKLVMQNNVTKEQWVWTL